MISFGLAEAMDFSIKDPLVAISLLLGRIMIGFIRDRHSKVSVAVIPKSEGDQIQNEVFPIDGSMLEFMNDESNSSSIWAREHPKL